MSPALRSAIAAEIRRVQTELAKLSRMLAALDGGGASAAAEKPNRGRRHRAASDPQAVLATIKAAGKINAIVLSHKLKQQGLAPMKKAELAALGVETAGVKGGTTYSYRAAGPLGIESAEVVLAQLIDQHLPV
jgi:hypothetical protein